MQHPRFPITTTAFSETILITVVALASPPAMAMLGGSRESRRPPGSQVAYGIAWCMMMMSARERERERKRARRGG